MLKEDCIKKHVPKKGLEEKCKIISITSSKGGVGKTSLCICLSFYTSKKLNKKTLLLEYDSSPGDFSSIFDIVPEKSLKMAFRFPERYTHYIKNISKNLDVLRGLPDPISAENIRESDTLNLFKEISCGYDYIIVDTQTVLNGMVLDVINLSGSVFLVTEYSMESLSRAGHLFHALTEKFGIDKKKIRIILNKKRVLRFFKITDISKMLKMPISAYFCDDRRFDKSLILFGNHQISRTRLYRQVDRFMQDIKM